MFRHDPQHLEFITKFVDSVTTRPFFEDLRRVSATYGDFPIGRGSRNDPEASTEAA